MDKMLFAFSLLRPGGAGTPGQQSWNGIVKKRWWKMRLSELKEGLASLAV